MIVDTRVKPVSAQANLTDRQGGQVKRSGRSQDRPHTQKALLSTLSSAR